MTTTTVTGESEETIPPLGWAVGILSVLFLIGLFLFCRAYSADNWAEDGAYGPAAQAARSRGMD